MSLIGIKKGPRILLDIGSSVVKVMEVNISPKKVKILNAYEIGEAGKFIHDRDIHNLPGLVSLIVESFKENGVKSRNISLNFVTKSLEEKLVEIPSTATNKDIREFFKTETANTLRNANETTHSIDYAVYTEYMMETRPVRNILLASIPKIIVTNMLREFKHHKYNIIDIGTDTSTLYFLSTLYTESSGLGNNLVIDVGRSHTNIMFLSGRAPVFIRNTPGGIDKLLQDLKLEIDLPVPTLEDILGRTGVDRYEAPSNTDSILAPLGIMETDYFDALDKVLNRGVVNDIIKSIEYVKMNMKIDVDNILVVGGGANITGMTKHMEERIEKPVGTLEIVSSVVSDEYQITNSSTSTIGSSFGVCVGMAIKGVTK